MHLQSEKLTKGTRKRSKETDIFYHPGAYQAALSSKVSDIDSKAKGMQNVNASIEAARAGEQGKC